MTGIVLNMELSGVRIPLSSISYGSMCMPQVQPLWILGIGVRKFTCYCNWGAKKLKLLPLLISCCCNFFILQVGMLDLYMIDEFHLLGSKIYLFVDCHIILLRTNWLYTSWSTGTVLVMFIWDLTLSKEQHAPNRRCTRDGLLEDQFLPSFW